MARPDESVSDARHTREALTAGQTRVLNAIEAWTAAVGYSPTFREIGAELGLTVATVAVHVRKLRAKGYLGGRPGTMRALVVRR